MQGGDLSSSKRDLGEEMRGCILVREGLNKFFSGTKKGQWDVCRETKMVLVLQRGARQAGFSGDAREGGRRSQGA